MCLPRSSRQKISSLQVLAFKGARVPGLGLGVGERLVLWVWGVGFIKGSEVLLRVLVEDTIRAPIMGTLLQGLATFYSKFPLLERLQ